MVDITDEFYAYGYRVEVSKNKPFKSTLHP